MGTVRALLCKVCRRYRGSLLRASSCTKRFTTSFPSPSSVASSALPREGGSSSLVSRNFLLLRDPSRSISQLSLARSGSDKLLLVDTNALVRKLEAQGFDVKQAEAITAAMTNSLNDSLQNVSDSFVSVAELGQYNMMLDAACTKLQTDVQSEQENKLSAIYREIEKLRVDIEKLRNAMRFETDKVSAGQRLDLNLERGRIKEELVNQSAETSNLTNKLDVEISALKTQLEASKYEVIKYCIGTIVSLWALGLALLGFFK